MNLSEPQRILSQAINEWKPVALIALFSGGYDSAITRHVLGQLDTYGLPIQTWAIDTNLAADGWHEYVSEIGQDFGWDVGIYDNKKGFKQFKKLVELRGCPNSRAMHTFVFQKLKERGFDALLKQSKNRRRDKVLFVSGIRRAESNERAQAAEVAKIGKSCKIFCAPIIDWSLEQCNLYRVENSLPDNPFYSTVRGSGDCQCNWGNFITLPTLKLHSPKLAKGNVATLDQVSRDNHGFGWDEPYKPPQQMILMSAPKKAKLTSPFLCSGCSRRKSKAPLSIVEDRLMQQGKLF